VARCSNSEFVALLMTHTRGAWLAALVSLVVIALFPAARSQLQLLVAR